MSAILEALDHVVEKLRRAGIKATLDAAQLDVPGAWVTLDKITPYTLDGGERVDLVVFLVARHPNARHALTTLDELRTNAAAALAADEWAADSVQLPNHSPDPLPALRASLTLEVH